VPRDYPKDFDLYDHYIHALEYLGYNFDRTEFSDGINVATAKFVGEDAEWRVDIEVTRTRRPPR
jgi:hypothetical protein